MFAEVFLPSRPATGRSPSAATHGMTLVEVLISLAILVLTTVGGVSGFMLFNSYAANSRNLSSAKALCQERIEEVQTMIFTPPTVVPTVLGQIDGNTYYLLGPGSNSTGQTSVYSSSGAYTGTNPLVTSTGEKVQVYVQQNGTTITVPGTRTSQISLASLTDASTGNSSASLNLITFTVTVNYTFRGKSYSYSMYTLRGPD